MSLATFENAHNYMPLICTDMEYQLIISRFRYLAVFVI